MIKRLQKTVCPFRAGGEGSGKRLPCLRLPESFLYVPGGPLVFLVGDLMNGGAPGEKIAFYIVGCVVCIGLILLTTYFQYNATYFATYTESGVRRITLAERLRKIPLSFFGKKDLADLTSTIMADCTFLEQSFSHFIPELAGSIISTVLISISPFGVRLAHGISGAVGVAGCLCYCRLLRKGAGTAQSESDGCKDGLRRRDSRVH